MRVRDMVKKYNSFGGDSDFDRIDVFLDTLSKKQSRKMFLSMFKASDRESQRIWKATKRFMQGR